MSITGMDCKTYRNSATWGTPTGVLVDDIRDLTTSQEWNMAEFKKRGYTDNLTKPTTRTRSVDGVLEHAVGVTASDANRDAFQDAFNDGTKLELFILNGLIATSGNDGLHAHFYVSKWERVESQEDSVTYNFTLTLAVDYATGEAPEHYTVP